MSHIVRLSPKGQFTLPVSERKKFDHRQFLLEVKGGAIVLKPIEIKVVDTDELDDFSSLASSSFDFWNNSADDVYEEFYSSQKKL